MTLTQLNDVYCIYLFISWGGRRRVAQGPPKNSIGWTIMHLAHPINLAEQMSVCMRWVDRSLCIHEDLLVLYSLSGHGQTAEVLTKWLKDVLILCQLPFSDLHGQGYDGANERNLSQCTFY